jgi:hypothetical protein
MNILALEANMDSRILIPLWVRQQHCHQLSEDNLAVMPNANQWQTSLNAHHKATP